MHTGQPGQTNTLPTLARTPKFNEYSARYTDFILGSGQGTKSWERWRKKKRILKRWNKLYRRVASRPQIKRVHVNRFIESRLKENDVSSWRTINLDVIVLRVVSQRNALSDGLIQRLPMEGLRPLKTSTKKRSLFTSADLDKLCQTAFETKQNKQGTDVPVTENAQEFVDYIRVLAYSGARRNEALGIRWDDVDFGNNQLFIRRQITERGIEDLKNRDARVVDFNPKLKAHLLDMKARSHDVSQWLFPSPQRGEKDIPAKTFRESLVLVRERARQTAELWVSRLPASFYFNGRHERH